MQSRTIFQAMQQGILICDRSARILYFNEAYSNFIGRPLNDVKGLHINEVRRGATAPQVISSGIPVEGVFREENGKEYFANIYPIVENGTVKGSISIVTTIQGAKVQEQTHPQTLEERVRAFERQEIQHLMAIYGNHTAGKKKVAKELGISLATLYNKLKED